MSGLLLGFAVVDFIRETLYESRHASGWGGQSPLAFLWTYFACVAAAALALLAFIFALIVKRRHTALVAAGHLITAVVIVFAGIPAVYACFDAEWCPPGLLDPDY